MVVLDASTYSKDRQLMPILLVATAAAQLSLSSQDDFGQRDHIFMLCYLPYIFLRWIRLRGCTIHTAIASIVGLLAGIGCCIKPQFLIAPILYELYLIKHRRSFSMLRDPEVFTAVAAGFVYALQFLLWPTAMKQGYFGFVLPLVFSGYSAFNYPLVPIVTLTKFPMRDVAFWMVSIVVALFFRKRLSIIAPLLIWTLSGYLMLVVQHKGFGYHVVPMKSGCVILFILDCSLLFSSFVALTKSRKFSSWINTSVLIGCLTLATAATVYTVTKFFVTGLTLDNCSEPFRQPIASLVLQESGPSDKVFFFDTGGGSEFPLVSQLNRQVGGRYLHVFSFAMAKYLETQALSEFEKQRAESIELRVLSEVRYDISHRRPKLIFIPDYSWPLPKDFSVFRYLEKSNFIGDSMSEYSSLGMCAGYHVFKL